MKEFAVTITVPAFADMLVEAETKEAAIEQIKENLQNGVSVDFVLELGDPDDADFFAYPLSRQEPSPEHPPLRDYVVTLEAQSYQEVPVKAVSEDAAVQLVYKMYHESDAIDFNDSHVVKIISGIKEEEAEDESEHDYMHELLTSIVQQIRDSELPDEEESAVLQRVIETIFGGSD